MIIQTIMIQINKKIADNFDNLGYNGWTYREYRIIYTHL
jgi:hypothetical protein